MHDGYALQIPAFSSNFMRIVVLVPVTSAPQSKGSMVTMHERALVLAWRMNEKQTPLKRILTSESKQGCKSSISMEHGKGHHILYMGPMGNGNESGVWSAM